MEINRRKNDNNHKENIEKKGQLNTRDIQIEQWREKHKKDIETIMAISNKFNNKL